MWPDTRFCDLARVAHPIVQAPMLGSAGPELATAVAQAGGLGSLACATASAEEVRRLLEAVRKRTSRPVALNFFCLRPAPPLAEADAARLRERLRPWYARAGLAPVPEPPAPAPPGFGTELAEAVAALRPAVVSFHFGVPDPPAVAVLKRAGIVLMATATSVAEARAVQAAGMDAVVAQGWEAGGHRGSHAPNGPGDGVGTLALVPQIVDAVALPVLAAGGIADARGVAAAFALGAAGVQIGTAFLACPEAATDPARRAMLARAADTDTLVTDAVTGRCARAARSAYARDLADLAGHLAPFPAMAALSRPLCEALPAEASFHLYGQAAPLAQERPAGALVETISAGARAILAGLGSPRPGAPGGRAAPPGASP